MVVVYAVVDDALSSDFPLGDPLEVFVRREDAERLVEAFAATIHNSRATRGSNRGTQRLHDDGDGVSQPQVQLPRSRGPVRPDASRP